MTATPSTTYAAHNQSTQTLDSEDSNPFIQHLQYFEFKLDFSSSPSTEWLSSNPNLSHTHSNPTSSSDHSNDNDKDPNYELSRPHIFSFNDVHLHKLNATTFTGNSIQHSHMDVATTNINPSKASHPYSIHHGHVYDVEEDSKHNHLHAADDEEEDDEDEDIIESRFTAQGVDDEDEIEADMSFMLSLDYDMESHSLSDINMNITGNHERENTRHGHSNSSGAGEYSANQIATTPKAEAWTLEKESEERMRRARERRERDHYVVLLEAYLQPLEIALLIPSEIRNLILLYFRNCTILYMLHGGKNCGVSCISTKQPMHRQSTPANNPSSMANSATSTGSTATSTQPQTVCDAEALPEVNKLVNFKIYDINSYHKQKSTPILTTTFMNEWDLNGMKLCLAKDVHLAASFLPHGFNATERRSHFDVLFRAQQCANSYYYFQNYRISAMLINPMHVLYHDIEAIQRKNKYIRTCLASSYHNTIKTFEIELPPAADIARFDMVWSAKHGLLIVGDASDIQALQLTQDSYPEALQTNLSPRSTVQSNSSGISDDFQNLQLPQWRYLTEIPQELKWKTQRTLQILNDYDSAQTEQLFIAGGINIAITSTHLLMGAFPFNQHAVTKKAAIYNLGTSQWTQLPELNYGRRAGASYFRRRQQEIYVGGGLQYQQSDVVEVYDMNKYDVSWRMLPKSIYKHQEKLSIYMDECISPSLLYCISKAGAECHDLRANKWLDLSQHSALGAVSQCLSNKPNILCTI
eukprot:CAMPEP_0197033948 /NCGR_PEP_ID=MMETSP1384-20130603/12199_1 /TAXON_ID=29189 /ORGANISM="Ammonia sp." /LENGTH=751 /DNA_ID=CAMNT_0042463813 /DNA_START=37 /DNA_END=2292 /DNA_ORIENTATION=-